MITRCWGAGAGALPGAGCGGTLGGHRNVPGLRGRADRATADTRQGSPDGAPAEKCHRSNRPPWT